jgi:hypothetical protein
VQYFDGLNYHYKYYEFYTQLAGAKDVAVLSFAEHTKQLLVQYMGCLKSVSIERVPHKEDIRQVAVCSLPNSKVVTSPHCLYKPSMQWQRLNGMPLLIASIWLLSGAPLHLKIKAQKDVERQGLKLDNIGAMVVPWYRCSCTSRASIQRAHGPLRR